MRMERDENANRGGGWLVIERQRRVLFGMSFDDVWRRSAIQRFMTVELKKKGESLVLQRACIRYLIYSPLDCACNFDKLQMTQEIKWELIFSSCRSFVFDNLLFVSIVPV